MSDDDIIATPKRICGTCLHFSPWPPEKQEGPGEWGHGKTLGDCNAPVPICLYLIEDYRMPIASNAKDCPVWTEK